MTAVNNLLDKAKQLRSLPSDNALAGELGVSRQRVSAWRHGTNHPDPVACARISELTGEPLTRVLGIVGEARAVSADEKRVWRRLAQAACLALIAAGWSMPSHAVQIQRSLDLNNSTLYALCEVLRRMVRRLQAAANAQFTPPMLA